MYVECTDGKGVNTTDEIGAGVKGTLRVVANASLDVAYKRSRQENSTVALQIVRDCLKIAEKESESNTEKAAVKDSGQQANRAIKDFQDQQTKATPHISLSTARARVGDAVTVSGRKFWANETVDIRLHSALVEQVQADSKGAFKVAIVVPGDAPPPGFSTTISATGESSAKSAQSPFRIGS